MHTKLNRKRYKKKPIVTVIQFPVKPKKSLLTVDKFNLWLKSAAAQTFPSSALEQHRFVYRFKHYPWRYLPLVKTQIWWLTYARAPFKYWLKEGWTQNWRFKLKLKGRWLYQLKLLTRHKRKKQSRSAFFKQTKVFRAQFKQGYLAKQADNFFNQRLHKTRYAWSGRLLLVMKFDQIVADIFLYRMWNLRRFTIKPISFRKILQFYLYTNKKRINKLLGSSFKTKNSKVMYVLRRLQYSLIAILHKAFKFLGVQTVLLLLKKNVIWVNGVVVTDPFWPCYVNDIVQLDIFTILRVQQAEEHYIKLKEVSSRYKLKRKQHRISMMVQLISTFKNPMLIRPRALGRRQYRYKKTAFLMYSWIMVAPKLGAWLMSQVLDKFGLFFEESGYFWRWHRTPSSAADDIWVQRLENTNIYAYGVIKATQYVTTLYKFHSLRSFTIFTAFERELFKKRALPWFTGRFYLNSKKMIQNFDLIRSLRLKPLLWVLVRISKKRFLRKRLLAPRNGLINTLSLLASTAVVDESIRNQNLKLSYKHKDLQFRGTRTIRLGRIESYLIADVSLFTAVVISRQSTRRGRKYFLNKDNLRFLVSFK